MATRWSWRLFPALALTTLTAAGAAQELALAKVRTLAQVYEVRLTSAWPQLGGAACRNGGDEEIIGRLSRGADGAYRGTLDRRTRLLFCGAHGPRGEECELVLEGDGRVAMLGLAVPEPRSPSGSALRVSWHPTAGHGATTRGACSADFKRAMREMYLSVRHGAEFAVPAAGGDEVHQRLKEYAWTVRVR
jgi:hypothetical protein